jgi:GNAT superfamily N-acetyltransferase
MTLPSFQVPWSRGGTEKARIYILEVRDRHAVEKPPIATILVERNERVERDHDGKLNRAKVSIDFRRLRDERHQGDRMPAFSGAYQAASFEGPLVSLTGSTTSGAVFLDLPGLEGQRIGTYLMNEIVSWAKQWTDASVCPISLLDGQAGDVNRERRNRFYEQFGIEFAYEDAERRTGESKPMPVTSLTTTESWAQKINVIPMDEFLHRVLRENTCLTSDLMFRTRALVEMRDEVRHVERRPLRWAARQLFWKIRAFI